MNENFGLLDPKFIYVPHWRQSTDGLLARWMRGEPVPVSDAECSAVAEHQSMQIRSDEE